jgi:hypothetical protein
MMLICCVVIVLVSHSAAAAASSVSTSDHGEGEDDFGDCLPFCCPPGEDLDDDWKCDKINGAAEGNEGTTKIINLARIYTIYMTCFSGFLNLRGSIIIILSLQ